MTDFKRVNIKENENIFTKVELDAITNAHNAYFYANMSDDNATTKREEWEALKELKKVIPSIINFIPDFYGNGDILILAI